MKVIQILHHSISPFKPEESEADLKAHKEGWYVRIAREILKRTEKYEIECWRPEYSFKEVYTEKEEGITYKIFPSIYLRYGMEYSLPLLKEIHKESKKSDIIIHFHGIYNHMFYITKTLFKNTPTVAQSHGGLPYTTKSNFFKYIINYLPQRMSFRNTDCFFVLTNEEREYLSKFVNKNKIEIQTMGVDFDIFKPMDKTDVRKKLNLNLTGKYLFYVGRLHKDKGFDYLLMAFPKILKEHPETILLLAGGGPYRKNLENLAKNLGIQGNIEFLGNLPNDQLPIFYNMADLFILPSLSEGVPVSCIESLACETPIVATKVGGIPDIISNFNGGGVLIPPKDPEAISNAVSEIFRNPGSFKVNRKNGERYYSWDNIIKNTIRVYDELFEKYYG